MAKSPNDINTSVAFCIFCVSVHIIFIKEINIKNERKKERAVRSLTLLVVIFKERKNERKKESCNLLLVTSKEKGKEIRQVVGKVTTERFLQFLCASA